MSYDSRGILSACNPALAHEALRLEDKVGTMLPCNVVVQDAGAGRTEVAAIAPAAPMQATDNPELQRSAQVAAERLSAAIDRLWRRSRLRGSDRSMRA